MRPDPRACVGSIADERRVVLKAGAAVAALVGCGLLTSRDARAAVDTGIAFGPGATAAALKAAGAAEAIGPELEITAPRHIDDGAMVPVTIRSQIAGTRELVVVADPNPVPVATRISIPTGTEARVSLRVRLAESGRLYAVARTGDGLYWTSCATEVESNGCE
jgi:sulfur-oxidizing protein SoxY